MLYQVCLPDVSEQFHFFRSVEDGNEAVHKLIYVSIVIILQHIAQSSMLCYQAILSQLDLWSSKIAIGQ